MIYIVGKAESGTDLELKQGENTYFHAKDSTTDAFISCISTEGEILWSSYLPALEKGYYNAFASQIINNANNTLIVVVNSYALQGSIEKTKSLIPACQGKLNCFVFSFDGKLLDSKSFTSKPTVSFFPNPNYLPRLTKAVKSFEDSTTLYFSGITYFNTHNGATFVLSMASSVWLDLNSNVFNHDVKWFSQLDYTTDYNASSHVSLEALPRKFPWGYYNTFSLLRTHSHSSASGKIWKCTREPGGLQSEDKFSEEILYSPGFEGIDHPIFRERWQSVTQTNLQYYANPINTYINWEEWGDAIHKYFIFPGTVQNIEHCKRGYLVQGIHCLDYNNGFFKKDGNPYTYSHDTLHKIPHGRGFYQERNKDYKTSPYLLIYESQDLHIGQNNYDYKPPLWGSYLNVDWMYEDFFHVTDSAQWKDIYQPYEAVLLSPADDRFFLIGNAKRIGNDLIDNLSMTEEILHHQGIVLAFSVSECPPEKTTFQDVRFLCPDDSVELKLAPDYAGFKLRFEPAFLEDGSIVLNADSSRAWARKEGTFAATLDGSASGCPDVSVDTVRISLSPYPEPVSALNPDTTIAACAAAGVVLQAVTVPDTSFSYLWFDGDTVSPKTVRFAYDSLFFASVEVNSYCTSFRDSVRIRFLPPYVELSGDSLLCTFQTFADTSVLLRLNARQDYFPDADWIFRWRINGRDASDKDFLVLHYADLQKAGGDLRSALVTVAVSLSDADVDGCTAHDTLVFSVVSLPDDSANIFLPRDSVLCAHLDLELDLSDTAGAYRCFWLDKDSIELPYGHDTARYTVQGMRGTDGFGAGTDTREPRFFQLRLDHKLCNVSFFDTLLVYDQVKPNFTLPCHDTLICRNEPVELDSLNPFVYRPFYGFEWNDGKKGSDYSFTDSGTYVLFFFVDKKYDFCGYTPATDTLRVVWVNPAMTDIFLPADTTFCKDLSITLDVRVPFPSTKYSWQDGPMPDPEEEFEEEQDSIEFTLPVKTIREEGTYNVLLLDSMGCKNRKEINVTIDECKPAIEIPNVFTPNGDGVNDVLKFKQMEKCTDVLIEIVDRWGQPVMKKKVPSADGFEWNGRINNTGARLPDGPYFYMVTYKTLYGKRKVQSGSITILGTNE